MRRLPRGPWRSVRIRTKLCRPSHKARYWDSLVKCSAMPLDACRQYCERLFQRYEVSLYCQGQTMLHRIPFTYSGCRPEWSNSRCCKTQSRASGPSLICKVKDIQTLQCGVLDYSALWSRTMAVPGYRERSRREPRPRDCHGYCAVSATASEPLSGGIILYNGEVR